jgi:hypothetical protein
MSRKQPEPQRMDGREYVSMIFDPEVLVSQMATGLALISKELQRMEKNQRVLIQAIKDLGGTQ